VGELERCISEFEAEFQAMQADTAPASPIEGKVGLGIERALMARFLDADLGRYYGGRAEDQIVFQLQAQIFARKHIPGNRRNLSRSVAPDFGVAMPATVLGVPWTPRRDQEPWASGEPPIRCAADLEGRPLPDFRTAGMMPAVLGVHAEMKRLLGEPFSVGFPGWCRGPLGNAFYLAGCERTLISLYQDPSFFHGVMRHGMDAMKKWLSDRAAYLGEPMPRGGTIFNDEVSSENFPAEVYGERIAPYDVEFTKFLGGEAGFHSCGNTTALMGAIASTQAWSYMHVSAWSDLDTALRCFPTTHLIICLHPYREVLGCPLGTAQARIREILTKCQGHSFTLCISELMPVNGPAKDLQRIKDVWALCEDLWPA
jgi:hypothetical protein